MSSNVAYLSILHRPLPREKQPRHSFNLGSLDRLASDLSFGSVLVDADLKFKALHGKAPCRSLNLFYSLIW